MNEEPKKLSDYLRTEKGGDVEKDYMTDEAPEFTVKDGRLAAIEETAHGETNQ